MIQEAPLQLYISALVFSPKCSKMRSKHLKEVPKWILKEPCTPNKWTESLRSLHIPHSARIYSIAVSPDSSLIASACSDCTVRIWDVISGTEKFTLAGNSRGWASVLFSSDGYHVTCVVQNLSQSGEYHVSMWNIRSLSGQIAQPDLGFDLEDSGSKTALARNPICAFSPDGNLFAAGSYPNHIWVWDIRSKGSLKFHLRNEHPGTISEVHFSSNGSLLISISKIDLDYTHHTHQDVNIWDTCTGTKLRSERGLAEGCPAMFLSGTNYTMTRSTVSKSKSLLVLRDAGKGLEYKSFSLGSRLPQKALFRPEDGKLLFASYEWTKIFVWTPEQYRQPLILESNRSIITDIAFSPNGRLVLAVKNDNAVIIWNIESLVSRSSRFAGTYQSIQEMSTSCGRRIRKPFDADSSRSTSYRRGVFLRSPDGNKLATSSERSFTIKIWDMTTGKQNFQIKIPASNSMPTFSPLGNIFAVLAETGIHFWDTETGSKGEVLKNGQESPLIGYFQISPGGRKFIYIPLDQSIPRSQVGSECHIWEIDNLKTVSYSEMRINCYRGPPEFAMSPNEELFVTWSQSSTTIELRDFRNSPPQRITLKSSVRTLKFAPDNKHVYILTNQLLTGRYESNSSYVWDIQQNNLKELRRGYYNDVVDISFSQDGAHLALLYGTARSVIDLYDISSLSLTYSYNLDFFASSIQFSPSGTQIITSLGAVTLPGESPPPSAQLFATRSWIQENGEDILAIPYTYRALLAGINGHIVVFQDSNNEPLFLILGDEGKSVSW